jgi:hypothetical protein
MRLDGGGYGADPGGATGPTPGSGPGSVCAPGHQGCPCAQEGATAECGSVHDTAGNYVTCSIGYSTCTGGTWGACIGNHLVTRSLPSLTLTTGGLRLQTTYPKCTNVCDPNGCLSTGSELRRRRGGDRPRDRRRNHADRGEHRGVERRRSVLGELQVRRSSVPDRDLRGRRDDHALRHGLRPRGQ